MRIVLTHGYFLAEDQREQRIMKPYPPLGLLYLSAHLERAGFPNAVFDATFSNFETQIQFLEADPPRLLGIYTNLMTKLNVLRLIKYLRSKECFQDTQIILGGPEIRHHGEAFLQHGADLLVLGEGEETLLELARHFRDGSPAKLGEIAGIAFLDASGGMQQNQERAFLPNLDELPLPGRQSIDLDRYLDTWRAHHGYSMISVSTMRGCPYACTWCSRAVYGKSYRRRSPGQVVEEMRWLREHYSFDRIWFVDDVFTINPRWMREFARLIAAEGPLIPYEAITRADRMNEEIVALLRESGCFRIWIGAESGSQLILDAMKRMVRIEKVVEMIHLAQSKGIETGTFLMLGYPGEKEEDIKATLRYLRQANPDHFTLTVAYPIKGTELYQEVESDFIDPLPWESSTDRDIHFRRSYPRRYYDHAMDWIQREMAAKRARDWSAALRYKAAALKSRTQMRLSRWRAGV